MTSLRHKFAFAESAVRRGLSTTPSLVWLAFWPGTRSHHPSGRARSPRASLCGHERNERYNAVVGCGPVVSNTSLHGPSGWQVRPSGCRAKPGRQSQRKLPTVFTQTWSQRRGADSSHSSKSASNGTPRFSVGWRSVGNYLQTGKITTKAI